MRYLAIDYGEKRIGLAVCDAGEAMAFPLEVLHGRKNLLARIGRIAAAQDIAAIVLGLPLNMDGSAGSLAGEVRAFADELRCHLGLPVHFQDERLSSFAAEEKLGATGLSRAKRQRRLDALAAAEILQAFLDARKAD